MQVGWQENICICSHSYNFVTKGKVSLTFNKSSLSPFILFSPTNCSKLTPCLLQLSLYKLTAQLQGFLCAHLWSIIMKCLWLGRRGAPSQTAIHQRLPSRLTPDLCSNNAASSRPSSQFSSRAGSKSQPQD